MEILIYDELVLRKQRSRAAGSRPPKEIGRMQRPIPVS